MKLLLNFIGIIVILGLIFLLSWDRKNIQWKTVLRAVVIQFVIALLLVKIPIGKTIVSVLSDGVTAIINCGQEGLSSSLEALRTARHWAVSSSCRPLATLSLYPRW